MWSPGGWRAGLVSCHDHRAPLEQGGRASTAELTEHLGAGGEGRHAEHWGPWASELPRFSSRPFPPSCSGDSAGGFEWDLTNLTRYRLKWISPLHTRAPSTENCFTVLQGNETVPGGRRALWKAGGAGPCLRSSTTLALHLHAVQTRQPRGSSSRFPFKVFLDVRIFLIPKSTKTNTHLYCHQNSQFVNIESDWLPASLL